MKIINKFLIATTAALSMLNVSCSSELDCGSVTSGNAKDSFLKLEIEVEGTRAGIDDTTFSEGDEILVLVETFGFYFHVKATYTEGEWIMKVPFDGYNFEKRTVRAIYPYSLFYDAYGPSELDYLGEHNFYNANVLEGWTTVHQDETTAKIVLSHQMSKVSFKINNPTDTEINITSIEATDIVTGDDYIHYLAANPMHYYDGFLVIGIYDDQIVSFPVNCTLKSGEETSLDLLMIPNHNLVEQNREMYGDLTGGVRFTAEVAGQQTKIAFDITTPDWEKGQQYTYNIKLADIPNSSDVENPDKKILYQQTFEDNLTPEMFGWSFGGASMTIGKDDFGNYLDLSLGQNNGRSAQVTWGKEIYLDETGESILPDGKYDMSFDFCIQQVPDNQLNSGITVFTNHTPIANQNYRLPQYSSGVYENYIFDLLQCNTSVDENMLVTANAPLIYFDDGEYSIDASVSYKLITGEWYSVSLSVDVDSRKVDYKINAMASNETLVAGSSIVPEGDSNGESISMYAEGLFILLARFQSQFLFDNICISY